MKGIYLTQDLSHADGIYDKIKKQVEQFSLAGLSVDFKPNPVRTTFTLIRNLIPLFSKQYFNTDIDWSSYDFVYIRKGAVLDLSVIGLLRKIKASNPSTKIVLEIPTYPYIDEFPSFVRWDIAYKERLATPKLAQYVDRIVTYSDDEFIFGVPCINISNAYEFKDKPVVIEKENSEINVIAVASLQFYHGYDRMIKGLIEYQKNNPSQQGVKFTLVGSGAVLKDYQKMVEENSAQSYINLTGRKTGEELAQYYQEADLALDSLGRHRSKIYYNSTLKGKEYLAKGLPIVSGVKTDLDTRNLSYYLRVPADDSNIDIEALVEFYDKLRKGKSKEELASEIFEYGKQNFSFEATFKPVVDYVKGKE